ncbi:MAG: diphthamide synthesis protein [Nanoarchaeota archaeon]
MDIMQLDQPLAHDFDELEYDLELERVVKKIRDEGVKLVGVQLPDGLKPLAQRIVKEIENQTQAVVVVWAGTNFGACDLATDVEKLGVDILFAWGHSEWKY